MYKYLLHLLLIAVLSLIAPLNLIAETHSVTVGDFFFGPQNLSINEGDTVRWVWESGGHDVAEGQENTLDSSRAFVSGESESDAGFSYEVLFDRTLINAYPKSGNRYDYVCRPHAGFMFGSVTVTRQPKALKADLTSWQVIPDTKSSASGAFNLTLSADEKSLSVSGSHNVSSPTSIILRVGTVGTGEGAAFCTLSGTSPVNGNCSGINQSIADSLYSGDAYIEVKSQQFLNGEIRGQIYRVSPETKTVSGRVKDERERPISGAVVSDGTRTATTSITGLFSLSGVSNGVYAVSGNSEAIQLFPNDGTNPYLVNGLDVENRNLTLFVETTPTPQPTPTSIPSECQEHSGVGVKILKPEEGETLKSFSSKLNASTLVSRATKFEYRINGGDKSVSESTEQSFTGRSGLNSLVVYALDAENNRVCGGVERLFSIESPLTEENFLKGKEVSKKAFSAKRIKKINSFLSSARKIFKSMLTGGERNPDISYLTFKNINRAYTLTGRAIKDPTNRARIRKLVRFLESLS